MTEFKETYPKSGHVNEVCKEWLVREDGALAYQLQSKEINEFYEGNKFRNAVVRQDFPTALNEQIKEKENAAKQSALYYQWMSEQEHEDAQLAQKITENLEKDFEQERIRQHHESEVIVKQLQRLYVEPNTIGPIESPLKLPTTSQIVGAHSQSNSMPIDGMYFAQDPHMEMNFNSNCSVLKETDNANDNLKQFNHKKHAQFTTNKNVFDNNLITETNIKYNSSNQSYKHSLTKSGTENIKQYSDVADAIRQYDLPISNENHRHHFSAGNNNISNDFCTLDNITPNKLDSNGRINIQQLSPEKYDYLMGNVSPTEHPNLFPNHKKVDSFEDPITYAQLGISSDEFLELNKRMEQEKRDEKLARLLQEEEQKDHMTQEEKDRLLAIEAQDKELARMLQEREKQKAKRAKEKARLRKQYQKSVHDIEANSNANMMSQSINENNAYNDKDAYANPIDFLPTTRHYNHLEVNPNDLMVHRDLDRLGIKLQSTAIKDDEIYTLPIDVAPSKHSNRPTTLDLKNSLRHSIDDPSDHNIDSNCTTPGSFSHSSKATSCPLEESSSPIPPYMPIQGTRRNTSLDGKKKKSKDKCTHQ